MSLAVRHPEAVATAAGHLNGVGFALTAQNVAAATATVGLPPAIAGEVSGLTATQFTAHAGLYRRSECARDAARPTLTAPDVDLVALIDFE
jgi:PE family